MLSLVQVRSFMHAHSFGSRNLNTSTRLLNTRFMGNLERTNFQERNPHAFSWNWRLHPGLDRNDDNVNRLLWSLHRKRGSKDRRLDSVGPITVKELHILDKIALSCRLPFSPGSCSLFRRLFVVFSTTSFAPSRHIDGSWHTPCR